MGRKKIREDEKKIKLSVVVDRLNFERMNENNINKSKFINWLLNEYYNTNKNSNE